MSFLSFLKKRLCFGDLLRFLICGWLAAATGEYLLLPSQLRILDDLTGLAAMSFGRFCLLFAASVLIQLAFHLWRPKNRVERWLPAGLFALLAGVTLSTNLSAALLAACVLVFAGTVVYGLYGWNFSPAPAPIKERSSPVYPILAGFLAGGFFLFVSIWGVCRVLSFCAPTYDFGIFAQMFHYMKEHGLPMTTVERDGLLSHFNVHVSPIYYLLLPLYWLVPVPEAIQVFQAAIMASACIPLWLLCKRHGLSGKLRLLVCAVFLLQPAYAGGAGYDIHENAFLTPLLLWLFYGIDRKKGWMVALFSLLTLTVKEDAAVYVAILSVFLLLNAGLHKDKWTALWGGGLLGVSLIWFFGATWYLANVGDGVMTYRYENFMYDGSGSLITVIKAVLLSPMKAVFECVDAEKLSYIGLTLLPLLGLPLLTRRFERYLLLIPYLLVNLMPDYQYQHNIMFQYNFGSLAFLTYLTVLNLSDLRRETDKLGILLVTAAVCAGCFSFNILPEGIKYPQYCVTYRDYYANVRETLDVIPQDASASATTFFTAHLSQRDTLYDIRYSSQEHVLSTEYIALNITSSGCFKKYGGYESFVQLLKDNGYELIAEYPGRVEIYRKPTS